MIADDHPIVLSALKALLEEQPNWKVVAKATDGRDAVIKAEEAQPDVAILDFAMPVLNGLEACQQIVSKLPNVRVLILSMHQTDAIFKKVVAAGARGYVLKSEALRDLVDAVHAVRGNKTFFTPRLSQLIVDGFLTRRSSNDVCLTVRKREVVQLIAEGKSNKEIGAALDISQKTAETHRANLMRRLNAHSISEVIRYAIRNDIIQG